MASTSPALANEVKRWDTYGLGELDKELAHYEHYLPGKAITAYLRNYVANRRQMDGAVYGT